jgi:hypothetical protein
VYLRKNPLLVKLACHYASIAATTSKRATRENAAPVLTGKYFQLSQEAGSERPRDDGQRSQLIFREARELPREHSGEKHEDRREQKETRISRLPGIIVLLLVIV